MDKKILFVVYQAPVGSIWTNEAFRTAFGMYGEDIEPSVLFVDEASISLSKNTKPETLGLLPISMVHRFVKRYETEVFGVEEHFEKFGVSDIDENFNAKIMKEEELNDFFHSFDNVIFM
ncbi:intracellular sulfur oxidation protein [Oceanotoga teriensis]|jgi:tRNA 2-thiouridine synthesizing protein C|uniref:tRNA 2-thiouridine synthesizing protein C n=1 Tax=Oceanotoga teriensis TaxID=515440 RepID=A0AA45HIQ1_9BACT|nr:intracellular sulfur oxidation protein [Oceanotoga teriensis]MDO7977068.1 intracellular sulfur oxidation protein [Oceanotoga teriensis]PWJ92184.1 tRNA 2-thiouridine synthesizing protein C [Oceanotoga teriensis]